MVVSSGVVEFYREKSVFITGGCGFIGKVLIEKLLRSCPQIDKIYLLIRPALNDQKSPSKRLDELKKSRVFQFALQSEQNLLNKLVAVNGDLTKPGLGLSDQDYAILTKNVSIVFHSAATVRFHGPLNTFFKQNVLGTESILKLCEKMVNLKCLIYVSTAYANCNLFDVQERVYPIGHNVDSLIERIIKEDSPLTPKSGDACLMGRPNSYTFSKAVAECMIAEKYGHLPVVICRPSIVTHSYKDPIDGWCDSLNGLAGTLLLAGLGIARTMDLNVNNRADIIPVDFVANSLIVLGAKLSNGEWESKVFHITSGPQCSITWSQILNHARESALKNPSTRLIRPIAQCPKRKRSLVSKVNYFFVKLFSHILFAYIFDLILLILRKKRMMVKVTEKMHKAFQVLEHFTQNEWLFNNQNYANVVRSLSLEEQRLFESNVDNIEWNKYCHLLYMGCRRYLLNEQDDTIPQGLQRQRRLTIIYALIQGLFFLAIIAIFLLVFILRIIPS